MELNCQCMPLLVSHTSLFTSLFPESVRSSSEAKGINLS